MQRIIPGVQVTVIKEVVPPQLAPSGVLGLVGLVAPPLAESTRKPVERVDSWARFRELYGSASALAMPEAQQALQNGVFELAVVEVESETAKRAATSLANPKIEISARVAGTVGNGLAVVLEPQSFQGKVRSWELRVKLGERELETLRDLSLLPGDERWIGRVLDQRGSVVSARSTATWTLETLDKQSTPKTDEAVKLAANDEGVEITLKNLSDHPSTVTITKGQDGEPSKLVLKGGPKGGDTVLLESDFDPSTTDLIELATKLAALPSTPHQLACSAAPVKASEASTAQGSLSGGKDAATDDYIRALELLEDEPDVDLVVASVQNLSVERASKVYGAVIAHCERMSADAKGRLGFGEVSSGSTAAGTTELDEHLDLVSSLVSDRFALFAPRGALGAAVGRIASLEYFQSPTFKSLSGLGQLEPALRQTDQRAYLRANIVPIAVVEGRGNVIVRGLTTDGDQINVRRVADRAVRAVKQIGEGFIGKLNTEDGRNALKQKLTEFMLQMAKDNAIVPSTDGSDPAFKLSVYSSQADFAKGIVRVDLALRPVRAIDYIYATVLVQV